jgi:hypothetical protein
MQIAQGLSKVWGQPIRINVSNKCIMKGNKGYNSMCEKVISETLSNENECVHIRHFSILGDLKPEDILTSNDANPINKPFVM